MYAYIHIHVAMEKFDERTYTVHNNNYIYRPD